ncbi:hypothetical protein E3T37_04290 [Cryobacterium sp. TMT2-10]|uniref:Uncharacterized protein n=1 Tax=Cryobacterium shii TaxID=1259235 RepID=A0AAQ2HEW4_9MICO|nr:MULTISPECIES: hypothetical protein [Cryobacterium]TFC43420.1 hypothetical protein E3O49_13240 [Cryobacterium shii]TFC89588.1 hypothetical protein E3T24_00770 [Cryobacterium sp. TmT2-59]TFD14198.1 hypothetical protein E3T42_12030 [Cryobacterium sp. TMT4-10]TFD41300.1 hypothetical protein E3T37_04290 [Cryobacterium sp. TMT2-10]
MSDGVHLDLSLISAAASNATGVKTSFAESADSSGRAADACGHVGLAEAVQDFADTWDDRRAGYVENLGRLAKSLTDIHTSFRELDQKLSGSTEPAPMQA